MPQNPLLAAMMAQGNKGPGMGSDPYNSMGGGAPPMQAQPPVPPPTPGPTPSPVAPALSPDMSQGIDPYNSGDSMGLPDPDMHGSVPIDTAPDHGAIIRAMHNAYANKGANPYESHHSQSKLWERSWKDKANRTALKEAKKAMDAHSNRAKATVNQPNYTEGKDTNNLTSPKSNTAGPTVTNQARSMPRIKR
jgi:hypothetical protein